MSKLSRTGRGRRDLLLLAGLFGVIVGCDGAGCSGCDTAPLPATGLPADQTIEGGAQVRVAPSGFAKVEQVVGGLVDDALGDGICLPEGEEGPITFCYENDGTCTNGCQVDLGVDSVDLTPEPGQLRIRAQVDIQADVAVLADIIFDIECTLNVTANDTVIEALVAVGVDAGSGELTVNLLDIPGFSLDPDLGGCGPVGDLLDFFDDLFGGVVEDLVLGLLEPQLQELIATLLPDPLGIEGVIDVGALLGGIVPGASGALEARVVPGGYAAVEGGGLSLGIISGVNADTDPATRAPELDSEPALCVPPMPAPDLAPLPRSPRNNFVLPAAGPFRGQPEDPSSDVAVGLSETFLDLAGHHAVTSGALCLQLGTEQVPQLNLGIIGILVDSLAELGSPEGNDPLLLVVRPTQAIDFTVGDGTAESPSLTIHIPGFQIDFYAYLFQRWVRGFTVDLDLDVGVNLEFATDDEGNPAIVPVLVGLDSKNIGVDVLNSEFLREPESQLEDVLPSLLDLALPLLLEGLPPISVPEFLGFRLDSLRLSRVTTAEDDFLAIHATLGASQTLTRLAGRFPGLARATAAMAAPAVRRTTARGSARLVRVTTPPPAAIRAHLHGQGGAMPEVVIDVPASDSLGRELEWTWNLGGGMWRPFRPGGRLVLTDGAFAMQGRYEIELRSRVAGDYRTLSLEPDVVPIVIDSVGPRILGERVALDRDSVVIPGFDLVSPVEKVQLAFGRAGDEEPATGWGPDRLSVTMAKELAAGSGQLAVWARDELGNQSSAVVGLGGVLQFHAQEEQGCACATGGSARAGGLCLLGLAALIGLGWRGRGKARRAGRLAALILAGGALASQPACSCGNSGDDDAGGEDDDGGTEQPVCESDPECAAECEPGSVPLCVEGACACEDDVRWGRIGQFSEMDVATDGTVWVSAYNSYHGDLMIAARSESGRIPDEAWEFVDGVPDGPVLVPDSDVRGGINEPGPDVGLYTDIAAAGDGAVVASYFDQDGAGLKLAGNRSGAWSSHVIDPGVPAPEEPTEGATYEVAGQYSAIAMRADRVPGVAYFAHVADAKGERTELRFAEASSPDPTGEADWTVTVVDSAAVPEPSGDPLPIPVGVGLFVNAARLSDGSPVVVYYDRVNGDLKLSRFDATAGSFTIEVLDGDGVDVGWYPAMAVDPATDVVHVSYVSASNNDLLYVNTADRVVEVIDDGYRIAGETDGGLPIPEFHFVGDDSGLVLGPAGPIVAYQDATSHELLVAERDPAAGWTHETVAGDEDPFAGGYGFYISAKLAGDDLVLSTWVIDQPNESAWVEILREAPPVE